MTTQREITAAERNPGALYGLTVLLLLLGHLLVSPRFNPSGPPSSSPSWRLTNIQGLDHVTVEG